VASLRAHIRIAAKPEEVWDIISDFDAAQRWVPGVQCTSDGRVRHLEMENGSVDEELVTKDSELRRIQYRIVGGVPVEHHLSTVDVLDDPGGALVIYSAEISPDSLRDMMDPGIHHVLAVLKDNLEGRGSG
jgi:carbon monoxide dehydrogenase subunit G